MSGQRLQQQFCTLYTQLNGKSAHISLQDIATFLACSKRNARFVLTHMAERGWLSWKPAIGRGKQNELIFNISQQEIVSMMALDLLVAGKWHDAFLLCSQDPVIFNQVVNHLFGISYIHFRPLLRIAYYYSQFRLDPSLLCCELETNICALIFNSLTTVSTTNVIEPDLAYKWDKISRLHWRFYLRKGVIFHNGQALTEKDVICSLKQLALRSYFNHINKIISPEKFIIDIYLSEPDEQLARTLSSPMAAIFPCEQLLNNPKQTLIGTGPYRVIGQNEHKLILLAHDHYFKLRPVIDEIEIWSLNYQQDYLENNPTFNACALDSNFSNIKLLNLLQHEQDLAVIQRYVNQQTQLPIQLNQGCHYLLLNRVTGIAKSSQWRNYLIKRLSGINLIGYLNQQHLKQYRFCHAYGLQPGWMHVGADNQLLPPPCTKRLHLVYSKEVPIYAVLAQAIKKRLAEDGICVEITALACGENIHQKMTNSVDLWLQEVNFATTGVDVLTWLLNSPLFKQAMPSVEIKEFESLLAAQRINQGITDAEMGKKLLALGQLIPLIHLWRG